MAVLVKSRNGLAYSSIKAINGLAVASIKTLNGLDVTAGSFVPTDIAGCVLWFNAAALSLADTDPVATWPDLSGTSNDATQATSGFRPTFRTNVLNGLPVVRFDGSDDFLSLAYTVPSNRAFSAFAVYKKRTTGVNMIPLGIDVTGGDNTGWPIYEYNDGNSYASGNGGISNLSAEHTSFVITSAQVASSVSQVLYFDGVAQSMTLLYPFAPTVPLQFIGWRVGDVKSDGDMAEIILYDSLLSTGDREQVEDYLGAKYGITITH